MRLFLPLIAALALCACQGKAQRPACPTGKVCLEYGAASEALTLDPQKSNLVDEFTIIGNLMMGLTQDSPEGEPVPGMAERWETSADGLVWTFHLRDARWSDGEPVTADDFVFSYRRMLDPKTAAIYAYMLYLLKNGQAVNEGKAAPESLGARALDARTLQLTLEHPAPYLPQLAKHVSFFPVPRHVVEKYGDTWVRPGRYVSNGPYRLIDWRLGDYIRVEKNPRFFDADKLCVDRINHYPTPDAVAAERRIERGELDINTRFQSNRYDRLRQTMPAYVHTHVVLATSYLALNTRDVPAFKDIRVRRALSMAVDREFITGKLMRAGQQPAYSFVPPGTANYARGAELRWRPLSFPRRQAEARRLLAEAGYGPKRPLKIEIKSPSVTDSLLIMQAVQADWREIGVDASVVQAEGQIAFADYRNRNFEVGGMNWYADYNDPLTFLGLFRSQTGAQNYADYSNPRYDALLDASDQEPDEARRAALLRQAEQLMLDDEGIIPVFFAVSRNLVNPRITGWVDNLSDIHRAMFLCVAPAA